MTIPGTKQTLFAGNDGQTAVPKGGGTADMAYSNWLEQEDAWLVVCHFIGDTWHRLIE